MFKLVRKIRQSLTDRNTDFELRMYNLVMLSGVAASFLGVIVCIAAGVSMIGILCTLAIFAGALILLVIGNRFRCFKVCKVTLAVCVSVLIPMIWLTGGGLNSGVNIWIIYGIVFLSLLFYGKSLYITIIVYLCMVTVCYTVGYLYPELVLTLDSTEHIMISVYGSAFVVALSTIITLNFQKRMYIEEQELNRIQQKKLEEATQAQKNFFANISHEIRTPINTIIGLNEMNLRSNLSEDQEDNCINIQGASKMLLSLINDILDLSKIQSGKMDIIPEQYGTADLMRDLVNMSLARAHEKGLEFHLDIAEDIPTTLYGDAVRVKQVLMNLLTNAIKYTPKGSVTLSIKGERIVHNQIRLHISVKDTGIGIRKENIGYLFNAFKRVDEEKIRNIEGTGLGLAISGQLVELMHGEIKVDSIYQQGTTFTVILDQEIIDATPVGSISKIINSHMEKTQKYAQSFEAPEAKVLIVDDNRMNRLVAGKLLRATKVQVDMADSGKECLEKVKQKYYHAIFMDHMMPDLDGIATLELIRKDKMGPCATTPVVAFTANAGADMEEYYKNHGFQGYLVKPINGTLFEAMLAKVLPKELIHRNEGVIDAEELEANIRISRHFKTKLLITTETISDLPPEAIRKYDIRLMPYYVVTEDGRFQEGSEIWTESLNEYFQKDGRVIRSSPPEVSEYETFFGRLLGEAEQIIHIGMSSRIGDGYDRALKAAESFANVHVVDSGNVSTGMGIMVIEAAQMAQDNYAVSEILRKLEEVRTQISLNYVSRDSKWLYRSGRASRTATGITRSLAAHPIFGVKKGEMKCHGFFFGSDELCYKQFIHKMLRNRKRIDERILFINYAGCTLEQKRMIRNEVEKCMNFERIIEQTSSAAVSCNCGPGTLGLIYLKKDMMPDMF